jgi:hypothetical protein
MDDDTDANEIGRESPYRILKSFDTFSSDDCDNGTHIVRFAFVFLTRGTLIEGIDLYQDILFFV